MHLTSVLLPAPFSPSSARKLPGRSVSDTSVSACNAPKRFERLLASIRGGGPSTGRGAATACLFACATAASVVGRMQSDGVRGHGKTSRSACGRGDGAEHAALHGDHLEGGQVVAGVGGAAAILQQQALEAAVVGVAHGRVHANVGRDAGQDQVLDAQAVQASAPGRWRRTSPCPACR